MIRKGKLVKNTAIALAIISVFGSTLSSVSAAELIKNTPSEAICQAFFTGNFCKLLFFSLTLKTGSLTRFRCYSL